MSVRRIAALVAKELAELSRNRSALLPVGAVAVTSMALPFFIGLAVPRLTGEELSSDSDMVQALAGAASELPGALALSDEGAVQALIFHRFLTLLLLVPVTGAITFASHSLISEKVGRSLEPLLATPITTLELLIGKVTGALIPSLAVMLLTFGLYLAGVAALAEPGVAWVLVSPRTLLLVLGVGPLASLAALQVSVLVSARANDPRTAQQFGALLILPLTALFMGQMSGMVVLTLPFTLLLMLGLATFWGLLLLLGVAVFDRETILTRWR
jgi:ABC-2 type transport system permease protein